MAEFILRPALLVRLAVIFLFGLLIAACGGGGGGGGIAYDGLTTQASVTETNGGELSGGAYRTGDAGTSVSAPLSTATATTSSAPASLRSLRIAAVARDALARVDMQSGGTAHARGATAQQSIPGACGGSASYSLSYNESTGSFSGTFSFNNYCEAGETVSGSMSFSGQLNIATEEFISFQINVNNLSLSDGSDSFAISGSIAMAFPSASEMTITETFNIRDGSGKVYRVEDFVVRVDSLASTVELDGTFYHPDHGYVVVDTTTAFQVPLGGGAPTSGSLTVWGAGNTRAVLTAMPGGMYQLDIDRNGDGTFDDTQTGSWSSL